LVEEESANVRGMSAQQPGDRPVGELGGVVCIVSQNWSHHL
jgi:hypothetical protein